MRIDEKQAIELFKKGEAVLLDVSFPEEQGIN